MSAASQNWNPPTFEVLPNAISSPALESGAMLCDSPDGPMTDLFGREVAPVRVSAPQEKAKGLLTLATSGHIGHASSGSAALQEYLENRLRQQLDTAGSTLFTLTWKRRRTPLGRRYLERAVSVLRTSGKGCTSVPTPQVHDTKTRGNTEADHHYFPHDLSNVAELSYVPTPNAMEGRQTSRGGKRKDELLMGGIALLAHVVPIAHYADGPVLASVPTPMSGSPATETYNAAWNNDYSRRIVELTSAATPRARDGHPSGAPRKGESVLTHQVMLATVATPAARDFKSNQASKEFHARRWSHPRGKALTEQAQLAASGPTATGGTGATASIGQLNPDYSRWLMGLPTVFSSCADTAMQSFRKSRRNSSGRQVERNLPSK